MPGLSRIALALISLATAVSASLPTARSYFEARRDSRLPAVLSIQSHLEEVESHLRAHPPAGLDADQSTARAERLDDLRAYRLRGDFPRNLDFPERVIPYFIDARGIACAVGHLMLLSGGADLAREIARTRNHAYIPELDDPRLGDWARRNGLTLEECAWIQPAYAPREMDVEALALDRGNRPWTLTGQGMSSASFTLAYLENRTWHSSTNISSAYSSRLCMVGDRPLVVKNEGEISWNGGAWVAPAGGKLMTSTCASTLDTGSFWLGGRGGLRRYTVGATGAPELAETLRAGALPGDTVVRIAHGENRIWAGTPKGLVSRADSGGPWSRHNLGATAAQQLGGLSAGIKAGTGAWFGLLKSGPDMGNYYPSYPFSEAGLGWMDGQDSVRKYHRGNSSLPSDTVLLAAAGLGTSIFLTCDRKTLLLFSPPNPIRAYPFTLPASTTSFECGPHGVLHIGTYAPGIGGSGASGLYRVEGDRLVSLGYPTAPNTIAVPERPEAGRPFGWRDLLGPGGHGLSRLDLLGRRLRALD